MSEHDEREDYDDEPWRGRATPAHLLKLPADLMWSFGLFQLGVSLFGLFSAVVTGSALILGPRPNSLDWLKIVSIYLAPGIVGLCVSIVVMRGSTAMRRGRQYTLAVWAACLTLTSLPCVGALPYTLPLGIWALILLRRPDVRAYFDRPVPLSPDSPPLTRESPRRSS